jgi:phosphoribosylanthranilate isomerase
MQIKFPFIQIAGILDMEDAENIISSGVEYLGFPLELDFHKEDLPKDKVKEIIKTLKGSFEPILITYLNKSNDVLELMKYLNVGIVQLHGSIETEELKELSRHFCIIKSLIIKRDNIKSLKDQIDEQCEYVDAFITDTFDYQTGASGATGKTHDWKTSSELIKYSIKPIILAGGLTHENVYSAIKEVNPAGVDSHTGVENENSRKSTDKLKQFVSEANRAFAEINSISS